jgi:uncharacterized protein involved in response to NO
MSGGLFSLLLWLLSMAFTRLPASEWMVLNLMFGVIPMFAFGLLLHVLPQWLKVTPLRYVSYGALFFLMLASQLVFYLSLMFSEGPGMIYFTLILLSWLLMLKNTKQFFNSSYQKSLLIEQGLFITLLFGGSLGVGLFVLQLTGVFSSVPLCWLGGGSYLLPLIALTLFRITQNRLRIH